MARSRSSRRHSSRRHSSRRHSSRRHSSRRSSHSSRRVSRSSRAERKTYHPCSAGGKADLRHTYHSRSPAGAAEKYAKHLVKGGSKEGTVHIKEVTRGCHNDKVYAYRYRGRRLTAKERDAAAFERDGVLVAPKVTVTVRRV